MYLFPISIIIQALLEIIMSMELEIVMIFSELLKIIQLIDFNLINFLIILLSIQLKILILKIIK